MGTTDEVMNLGNIEDKFKAFGFESITIDGHDERAIDLAYTQMKNSLNSKPKAIVARSIKGKGVSFMENNNIWHYTRLNSDTHTAALKELGY